MKAILIDIGNTRIKWRVIDPAEAGAIDAEGALDQAWRGSGGALALDEIDQLATHWRGSVGDPVDRAWISNVASPAVGTAVERVLASAWPGIRVERVRPVRSRGGVVNGYRDPSRLGPDRWLAMIGAHRLVADRSLLVCSFGTATTIDLLLVEDGGPGGRATFVGGLILPGIDAMRSALVERTARLPDRPGRFLDFADDTDDAIASGVLSAQLGAVERAWRDAQARVPPGGGLLCLATGGAAPAIVPSLDDLGIRSGIRSAIRSTIRYRAVPDLVLRGLAVIAHEQPASIDAIAVDPIAIDQAAPTG